MAHLLDTNVISETVKAQPNPGVKAWLESTPVEETYLSALALGELVQGVVRAPKGRRQDLETWLKGVKERFNGCVLPLDAAVMEVWGTLMGEGLARGQPLPALDAMLAATALHHGLILVTRNTRHFAGLPIVVLDPREA